AAARAVRFGDVPRAAAESDLSGGPDQNRIAGADGDARIRPRLLAVDGDRDRAAAAASSAAVIRITIAGIAGAAVAASWFIRRDFRTAQHAVIVFVEPPECFRVGLPFPSFDPVVMVRVQIVESIAALLVDGADHEFSE